MMVETNEMPGYKYKAVINLGQETVLTACFNNGNGSWDNNNYNNYQFGVGVYTCRNGVITKI